MDDLRLVTYCGLYCGLCGQRRRIPPQAATLRDTMAKEGWAEWGSFIEGFNEFWSFLNRIAEPAGVCPGCRTGGGPPFCGIRKCALDKNMDVCVFCEDYPCHRLLELAKGYPTLIPDGLKLKETGLKDWIELQEKRVENGFAYTDIRCEPYRIPDN